ncbi:threonine aspartase 1-like protein [Leptotrombidium deliense]|uniref:Threonine aspartase 1-like protein n=1 Tax=Leptotrombidium deliense TaxID=299467 RepID=A0A443SKY5_9ACAR|nr:threonine aspartase 1-like protein [Leptotrombidium deliense]
MVFVAVHAGAGFQSEANRSKYLTVCKEACAEGVKQTSAIEAVVSAICCLEDNQITNAGFGSNLCNDGSVECDASLMDGDTLQWAAVGALNGIKNPIKVAKLLLNEQIRESRNKYGLVAPNMLVGEGAKKWALKNGAEACDSLVSVRSKQCYVKYKRKIESANCSDNDRAKHQRLDTVGAVAVDAEGKVAAAVSSGGILLKNPGRVGQAAMYACGVWAEDCIAVTTSGVGEYLTKTLFAKECASYLQIKDDSLNAQKLHDALLNKFINSKFLKNVTDEKSVGCITALVDSENDCIEFLWGHNTQTMALAYCTQGTKPVAVFSKLPQTSELVVNSILLPFKCEK